MFGVGSGTPGGVPCLHCCGGPLAAAAAALPAPLPQAARGIPTGVTLPSIEPAITNQAENSWLYFQRIARRLKPELLVNALSIVGNLQFGGLVVST